MIKYIGSKRTLVPHIVELVRGIPDVQRVCDLFTGTTRVAQGFKRAGFHVIANDLATYSEVLGRCYLEADANAIDVDALASKLAVLEALPDVDGYVTQTFCRDARYFQPANGMRIDAMRAGIDELATSDLERAILLTSLMEAADRVDSTTGLHMAYLKQWSARSHKSLELRVPELIPGTGTVLRADANELAPTLTDVDLVYLDPPYNQHSYYSNYHIWETLIRNDAPETYGIARKRVDCQTTKSPYNSKRFAWDSFSRLVRSIDAPYVLVSFNDEGYFPRADIEGLLRERGETACVPVDFKRYVGAQIGIHSPTGAKVGRVGKLRNTEFLFLVGTDAERIVAESGLGTIDGRRRPDVAGSRLSDS